MTYENGARNQHDDVRKKAPEDVAQAVAQVIEKGIDPAGWCPPAARSAAKKTSFVSYRAPREKKSGAFFPRYCSTLLMVVEDDVVAARAQQQDEKNEDE